MQDQAEAYSATQDQARLHGVIEEDPEAEEAATLQESANDGAEAEMGNETILEDLVAQHAADGSPGESDILSGDHGGYDYADEVEEGDETSDIKRESLPLDMPVSGPSFSGANLDSDRQRHIANTRSINGSWVTDAESEVGQVYEAVKRNVSMRLPPMIVPYDASTIAPSDLGPTPRTSLSTPQAEPRRSSHTPTPTRETGSMSSRGGGARRGSAPIVQPPLRRDSSNPPVPSPLRPAEESLQARIIAKKSSFSFATPASPLRTRVDSISPASTPPRRTLLSASPGISPRSQDLGKMLSPSSPIGEKMSRQPSNSSQLRNQVSLNLTPATESDGEGEPPGLALSVASESSSSDGNILESPLKSKYPTVRPSSSRALPQLPNLDTVRTKPVATSERWTSDIFNGGSVTKPELHRFESSHASPPESPSGSIHSILPSVRCKIAQLQSRDEALLNWGSTSSRNMAGTRSEEIGVTEPRPSTTLTAKGNPNLGYGSVIGMVSDWPSDSQLWRPVSGYGEETDESEGLL